MYKKEFSKEIEENNYLFFSSETIGKIIKHSQQHSIKIYNFAKKKKTFKIQTFKNSL
jgi:hypothetical protein